MAVTPPALVNGATRVPLPFGLFSAVQFRDGDRWESGVQFEGLGCDASPKIIGPYDCEGIDVSEDETPDITHALGLPKDLSDGGLSLDDASTFMVYESYSCTPIGNPEGHAERVAEARLLAREEAAVETAFHLGTQGNTPNLANPTSVGSFTEWVDAIAALEQKIADSYGALGVLHMSRETATILIKNGLVEASGQKLRTKLNTPVVAGTGYSFGGVIGTPAIFGYRSNIFTSSNRAYDLLDRGSNDMYGIAERNYLLGMDSCGVWSANITTP